MLALPGVTHLRSRLALGSRKPEDLGLKERGSMSRTSSAMCGVGVRKRRFIIQDMEEKVIMDLRAANESLSSLSNTKTANRIVILQIVLPAFQLLYDTR